MFQGSDPVYPGEGLRDDTRLVALDSPDVVPFDIQITEEFYFPDGFLDVVLAKTGLSRLKSGTNGFSRLCLADGEKGDCCRVPSA